MARETLPVALEFVFEDEGYCKFDRVPGGGVGRG